MIKTLLNKFFLPTYNLVPAMVRFALRHATFLFPNTVENNLKAWSRYDWSTKGEEWSKSSDWKEGFLRWVLFYHIPEASRVLEIGPGAGRWTEYLLQRSKHLVVVDLVPKCIELCKTRFGIREDVEYHVNDGFNLSFVPSLSIDRIWSWDVFVHLPTDAIEAYISQFSRILSPNGQGIIHHARTGVSIGWRSNMTAQMMLYLCEKHGLRVIRQFDSWNDGRDRIWPDLPSEKNPDTITVFARA